MDKNALKFASPEAIKQLKLLAAEAKRIGFSYSAIYRSSLPKHGLARIKFYLTRTTVTHKRELHALGFTWVESPHNGAISWVAYVNEHGVVKNPQKIDS